MPYAWEESRTYPTDRTLGGVYLVAGTAPFGNRTPVAYPTAWSPRGLRATKAKVDLQLQNVMLQVPR